MKRFFLVLILILIVTFCYSKNKFNLSSSVGEQKILINGNEILIDSLEKNICTNYPKFDTLVFISEVSNSNEKIICNFKPDSSYTITYACCESLDIIPNYKLKNGDLNISSSEQNTEKIQETLIDKPYILIKTKKTRNNLYVWIADVSCDNEYKEIKSGFCDLGVPKKCLYWSNVTTIMFFKTDKKLLKHDKTYLEEFLNLNNIVELASISYRLFDDERFIIYFDEKSNKAEIKYK